ncbi:MAG: helix-turn-helix domain-containing protein [Actinophytocola sp.]|nr:helix-turn-helix domain-containing protein [Actinophytocola sp.]
MTPSVGQPPADEPLPLAPAGGGPTVLRITLGGQLRQLRQRQGISREAAGDAIRASHAKISRLERGQVGFKERDIRDLLTLYQVTDPDQRGALVALARQANEPGWWHKYNDLLPSWFETYLGLEQAARVIRNYENQFIPGLLQTADYARAVTLLGHANEPASEVERRIDLRMHRQQMLTGDNPPTLWAIIDEAALRRAIGGSDVMRAQIDHLIAATELPNVTVQVLPNSVGGHAAAGGPFSLLRFPDTDLPDIVYLEQLTSALYLDKRQDIEQYLKVIDVLSVQAATPEKSIDLLTTLRAEL